MISRSTLLHLRIPFSYFLMPIFIFSLGLVEEISLQNLLQVFIIVHVFLYPASNAFNSYFDKDVGSIGGLKNPPPVNKQLYFTALIFDVVAVVWGLLIDPIFGLFLFVYGLVSKAYSHPSIRLKKYPYLSWVIAAVFQGFFTVQMCLAGLEGVSFNLNETQNLIAGILSTLILLGSYPMTQIYQHEEDLKRGDHTLSAILGVIGTFHFVAISFSFAIAAFVWYYFEYFHSQFAVLFVLFMTPVLIYFLYWYSKVRKNLDSADFEHTMLLNVISATCLNLFFGLSLFI